MRPRCTHAVSLAAERCCLTSPVWGRGSHLGPRGNAVLGHDPAEALHLVLAREGRGKQAAGRGDGPSAGAFFSLESDPANPGGCASRGGIRAH